VSAEFPSPADDHIETRLDLNEHLIREPAATFFVRAVGSSMTGAGVHDGDLLIVDRSLEPRGGNVVSAVLCGDLTVKRIMLRGELCLDLEDCPPPKQSIASTRSFGQPVETPSHLQETVATGDEAAI